MATAKELEKRIAELEALVVQFTGQKPAPLPVKREDRADYIAHGSQRHMDFLGLRKTGRAKEDKDGKEDLTQYKGYEMADTTLYGLTVRPGYLRTVLMQKVHELTYPMPVPQSKDPRAPNYAPPLWQPNDIPVRGIV